MKIQNALRNDENSDNDVDKGARPNPGASIAKFYARDGDSGFQDGAARRWLVDTFNVEKTASGERDSRLAATFLFDSTDERGPDFTIIYGATFTDYGTGHDSKKVCYRKLLNDHRRDFESFNSPNNAKVIYYTAMLKLRFAFFLSFITLLSCDKKSGGTPDPPTPVANTFTNPLLSSGPDPWVIKKDISYYYSHTLGNRIAVWKTQKMSELKNATVQTIWTASSTGPNSNNVWAPELHYLNNKWYAYYTAGSSTDLSTQRTFVLENESDDPGTGTWVDKGKIYDPASDFFAIDGTVFTHNTNTSFIWSGQASASDNTQRLYIASMSDPWTLETARSLISSPQYEWEMAGAPPAVNEGPEILKNASGRVFLIYSASGCWTDDYALGMLSLAEGSDPMVATNWTKSTLPVFTKNTSGGVFGPGHNTFFKSADSTEDWILYHANPSGGQGCGDARNPRMQKLTWHADGTPNFGQPVAIGLAVKKPSGE